VEREAGAARSGRGGKPRAPRPTPPATRTDHGGAPGAQTRRPVLSEAMTEAQFENGYWYASELRDFARVLGIPSAAKLRKDELERAVRHFLRTGEAADLVERAVGKSGTRDVDVGLTPDLPVSHYTSKGNEGLHPSRGAEDRSGLHPEARYPVPLEPMARGAAGDRAADHLRRPRSTSHCTEQS
jgi:hypothetical protein